MFLWAKGTMVTFSSSVCASASRPRSLALRNPAWLTQGCCVLKKKITLHGISFNTYNPLWSRIFINLFYRWGSWNSEPQAIVVKAQPWGVKSGPPVSQWDTSPVSWNHSALSPPFLVLFRSYQADGKFSRHFPRSFLIPCGMFFHAFLKWTKLSWVKVG